MYKFFIYFCIVQVMLFSIGQLNFVHRQLIIPFTEAIAHISTWLIQLFDDRVLAEGI